MRGRSVVGDTVKIKNGKCDVCEEIYSASAKSAETTHIAIRYHAI
jgi:hypothetical protein